MKILVTGGAGFIASNIVDAMIEHGHEVVVVDNLSTGKKENLNKKAKFCKIDIRDKGLEKVFAKENPQLVCHHAAQIDVRKSVVDPIHDAEINTLGFLNVMQNSVKYGVKKVINVSSGGVIYGEDAKLPIREDYEPKKPLSPYGITKLDAERYLYFYNKIYGIKFTTFRYSNVFGTRQDPHGEAGVVSIFSSMMLTGKTPTIYGDGKQTRDYVYVKDVVAANLLAIEKGDNEAFNIGTGKEVDVNTLFNAIKEITGFKNSPSYAPARQGELARNCLNTDKAKKILGWQPEYSLKDGLKETVEWIKTTV
jgi:UDP-glucose 4-epimerase